MSIPPSIVDPNRILMTGENPFVRLAAEDSDDYTTAVSFWRMTFCPAGPGHVLFAKSELTDDRWRIYSDNEAMTRWLQQTIQGMLAPDLKDESIAVISATFEKAGDPLKSYSETIRAGGDEIVCRWSDMREPMMLHTQPGTPAGRPYGLCTVFVPALEASFSINGTKARGKAWPRDREGRPFSTSSLAFSESWTEAR
ncbi:MAG: hypothetical protein KKB37_15595 [Alphaproteobacteria bacterium]|nr:hypothetical protein [Alphaproteobacteria bacterium]